MFGLCSPSSIGDCCGLEETTQIYNSRDCAFAWHPAQSPSLGPSSLHQAAPKGPCVPSRVPSGMRPVKALQLQHQVNGFGLPATWPFHFYLHIRDPSRASPPSPQVSLRTHRMNKNSESSAYSSSTRSLGRPLPLSLNTGGNGLSSMAGCDTLMGAAQLYKGPRGSTDMLCDSAALLVDLGGF